MAEREIALVFVVDEIDRIRRYVTGIEMAAMGLETLEKRYGAALVEMARTVRSDLEELAQEILPPKSVAGEMGEVAS